MRGDDLANEVRERLWLVMRDHYRATGDRVSCPPVSLSREEFAALKQDWFPVTDGDPDFGNEPFYWRDVPFVVRAGGDQ